ncbi:MAG: S8 family serine peptidase [Bacteroidales bacterium]
MTYITFRSAIVLAMLTFYFSIAIAQNQHNNYDLLLKIGNVNLTENVDNYVQSFDQSLQKPVNGKIYKIIQFYQIPTREIKDEIESLGIELIDYLPNYAFVVSLPVSFDFSQIADFSIRSISDILPEYKQDPYILDKNYPEWALRGNNQMDIIITYFNNIPYFKVASEISNYVIDIIQDDEISKSQIVRVDINSLESIIELPFVQFVEPVYPEGEPENYTGKTLHRSNVLNSSYAAGRHYDGTDVNIMLQDDGYIGPHADYEGRIGNQFITSNSGDHGDHCAGIIFGSGNIDPTAVGQAPGATIYTYGAAPAYPGFSSIPSHYGLYDIRISSTSYSNGCNAGYTSLARTMDIHINQYESLMHVFSAGNDGNSNCGYGAGAGWGNITGGHKIGKNVMTVANLSETSSLAGSSSRGPAHDGRIKPDISAKGSNVYSTVDVHEYAFKSGTSMSCPGVSGSLAQLYQAYKELNNGEEPKGGFIKGLTLNTADDLGNTGPDFKFGWGQINNFKAVKLLEDERYETDEIEESGTNYHTFEVPAGTKQIKVMVYWTDKEASIGTNKALVNDLNIQIEDPSSVTHLPWLLNHYPHPDSLDKPAIKGIDALNNMEQVSIDDPAAGTYTLTVEGFEVPWGPQEYFVFYEYIMNEINLTYPIGGESFAPGENVMVRWDAFGDTNPFYFSYSVDGGLVWIDLSNTINPNQRYFTWSVPPVITSSALVRITRDGLSDTSPETFNIMGIPENIEYPRSCPESVLVKWDPVEGAISYDVLKLGEKYMEVVGSTAADSMMVEGISYEEEYFFSVRAIGADNAIGRRAIAKMKDPGVWNCLFNNDLALSDIISPPLGVLFLCQDYSEIPVRIEVSNSGLVDIQNVTAHYQFENGSIVTENIPGIIEPGESIIHEFASSVSLPSNGNYDLAAWVESPGDENMANDLVEGVCKLKISQYMENFVMHTFDEFNSCGIETDCEDVTCYIDNKWSNLENEVHDDIDWRLLNGITQTPNTGPIGDHTTGTIEGRFLYIEPSGECYNKKAILNSPCIDLSGIANPGMMFWFHMYGTDIGSLHVDIISNGMLIKDFIPPLTGNWGNEWHEAVLYLNQFSGENINVRFRGYTADGEYGDIALDDFTITEMTNINSADLNNGVHIFPNPSDGLYNIRILDPQFSIENLEVIDLAGRSVYSLAQKSPNLNNQTFTLDISGLEKGMYFLIIKSGDTILKEKLHKY